MQCNDIIFDILDHFNDSSCHTQKSKFFLILSGTKPNYYLINKVLIKFFPRSEPTWGDVRLLTHCQTLGVRHELHKTPAKFFLKQFLKFFQQFGDLKIKPVQNMCKKLLQQKVVVEVQRYVFRSDHPNDGERPFQHSFSMYEIFEIKF